MENEKIFDILEKFYIEFSQFRKETGTKFDGLETRFDGLETRFDVLETRQSELESRQSGLETEVQSIKNTVIRIENDHGAKLEALFDGYIQNSEKLDRIEKQVTRHEEVLLRNIT